MQILNCHFKKDDCSGGSKNSVEVGINPIFAKNSENPTKPRNILSRLQIRQCIAMLFLDVAGKKEMHYN